MSVSSDAVSAFTVLLYTVPNIGPSGIMSAILSGSVGRPAFTHFSHVSRA